MAVGVLMPKAGITVEECVITEWLKKKGDHVNVGDVLFTYETDKASFECESTAEGELLEIFYEDGDEVPVLVNVCAIGQPGDDISGIKEGGAAPAAEAPAAAAPAPAAPAPAAAAPAGGAHMAQGVLMPKAGITVEECVITEWLKKEGDQVNVGDVLFTYETDKASFECESTAAGTLLKIFYEDGDEVPVLVNVCAIGQPGDSIEGLKEGTAPAAAPAEAAPAPAVAPAPAAAPAGGAHMAQGVLMPKAGITVEECVITEWLKKEGDQVNVGDVLFTYETDKASFECESTAAGTLLKIFYGDGDEVPVLVNVCAIGQPGDSIEGLKEGTAPAAAPAPAPAPAAASAPAAAPVAAPAANGPANPDAKVSPRARKAAAELGVDATAAAGTGAHGRVMEVDVKTYAASAPAPTAAPAAAPAPAAEAPKAAPAADDAEYTDVKFSGVRKGYCKGHDEVLKHHGSADPLSFLRRIRAAGAEKADQGQRREPWACRILH